MAWYSRPGTCWVLLASTSTIGIFGALSGAMALACEPYVRVQAVRVGAHEALVDWRGRDQVVTA